MRFNLLIPFILLCATAFGQPLSDALDRRMDRQHIVTTGTVINVFRDEIDANYAFIVLTDGNISVPVAITITNNVPSLEQLMDADLSVSGSVAFSTTGARKFTSPFISVENPTGIQVVKAPPANPFLAPALDNRLHMTPDEVTRLGKRSIEGRVSAVWGSRSMLVKADDGRPIRINLISGKDLPPCGARVQAAGYPYTDLFHVNLTRACCRILSPPCGRQEKPDGITVAQLFLDDKGRPRITGRSQGRIIRFRGIVRSLPSPLSDSKQMSVSCGEFLLSVDPGAVTGAFDGLDIGCTVEVSGVCIMRSDSWPTDPTEFPHLNGYAVVIRDEHDIQLLAHAPWWTPVRIMITLGILIAALIGFAVWNRMLNRVIVRRSHELAREQVASRLSKLKTVERTRLAVELHDTLSQNLEGVACQMAACESVLSEDPVRVKGLLATASQMLDSCRTELRRCLFDLRSDTLGEHDFNIAIRKTLDPVLSGIVPRIRFDVRRACFSEPAAHAVLSIVRELVANAIHHGKATDILIAGTFHDDILNFSVRDNGCGFDVKNRLGPAQGHFGLQGIRERIRPYGGNLDILSHQGGPTRIKVSMKLIPELEGPA